MILRPLLFASALLASPGAFTAEAEAAPNATLIKVSAQGEVRRVPDVAQIGVGVVTQAPDAQAAMRDNARRMSEVIAAVRKAGIAERDVTTSGVSLSPQYQYGENVPPRLVAYQAHNRVSIKVREIGEVGAVLDALVAQGANQVDGPHFTLDRPEAALDEARRAALEVARARAKLYADALGLRVQRVVSVDETGTGFPEPRPMMLAKAEMADAPSTPVMPGEQVHAVTLQVVFELH